MRFAAIAWLIGWSLIGLPWRSLNTSPSLEHVRLIPFGDGRPLSQALNVAAFVPCGALAIGLGFTVPAGAAIGAAISATTEVLQLFSTRRYPSVTDFLLNTIGAALGAAGAVLGRSRLARRRLPHSAAKRGRAVFSRPAK